ncbi:hypothetical protein Acr_29g0008650 [Actinidia rufa]|uniref:Uncharacterized protein n=1 Tax=Actinidia rufa TaxID=165716 RepID=A0A7J0HF19_9ERIC|nr:hypothetical protein Acr_29g0008650 [Actinidia rufa]
MDSNRSEARSEGFLAAIGELEAPPSKKARIGRGCEECSGDSAGVGGDGEDEGREGSNDGRDGDDGGCEGKAVVVVWRACSEGCFPEGGIWFGY